jgi:hypothetical protein
MQIIQHFAELGHHPNHTRSLVDSGPDHHSWRTAYPAIMLRNGSADPLGLSVTQDPGDRHSTLTAPQTCHQG